jgi:hypothetical protein
MSHFKMTRPGHLKAVEVHQAANIFEPMHTCI